MINRAIFIAFGLCMVCAAEEFRLFKNSSGRTIEARTLDYRKGSTTVRLLLSNGREGNVPLDQLSQDDRTYLEDWASVRTFLDPDILSIEVQEDASSWQSLDDGRDKKKTTYTILVTNHGPSDFENVRVEYCLYNQREHYIGASNNTISWQEIPSGEKSILTETIGRTSYRRKSSDFLNETVGIRIRIYKKAENGTLFFREACHPNKLSLNTHSWTRGEQERLEEKENSTAPEDYPVVQLEESEVRALAESFVTAFMDDDHEAFKELLRPMHPGERELDNHMFHYYHHGLRSMKVAGVYGRNVELSLRQKENNRDRTEWLMITPSGHIKYIPYLFLHPLKRCVQYDVRNLLNEDSSRRKYAAASLKRAQVPLFKYNADDEFEAREQDVFLILDWLNESGRNHDTTEPGVPLPSSMFDEYFKLTESYIKQLVEKQYR